MTFAATSVLSYAATYSISVTAKISGQTTWSAATTATFTYVDPCVTATLPVAPSCMSAFSAQIGFTQTSSLVPTWQDSVTSAINNGTIICPQTVTQYEASAPSSIANNTMFSKFTYTATSSTSTSGTQAISAAPTLATEVGIYSINVVACIVSNPTSCTV